MNKKLLISLFLSALALRIFLIPNPGFEADIAFWKSWGLAGLDHGALNGLAMTNNNYPTPFAYLLAGLVYLYAMVADPHNFNQFWNSGNVLFLLLAKLPSILADLGIAGIILFVGYKSSLGDARCERENPLSFLNFIQRVTREGGPPRRGPLVGILGGKREAGPAKGYLSFPPLPFSFYVFLSGLYLFNPITLIDGALWGQVDSLGVFVFLISILLASSGKYGWAGAIFILSMMTKLQNMIYAPLFFLLVWILGSYKGLVKSSIGAVVAFILLNAQVLLQHNMETVWNSLTVNYDYFPYLSLNAYNLWWIVSGGRGMELSDKISAIGLINAKTAGLLLFSSGYLLAVIMMINNTVRKMWNAGDTYEGSARGDSIDSVRGEWKKNDKGTTPWVACVGDPVEHPQSRNCHDDLEETIEGSNVVRRGASTDGGLRDEDVERGIRTTGPTDRNTLYSHTLFRFFTALIIVNLSFFLFQTQSHDRYAFPASVFLLFWGAFFIFRTNTEKNYGKWWTTKSFQIFIIGYIIFSFVYFLNLHTALAVNYPGNALSALLPLRQIPFTLVMSAWQVLWFILFLLINIPLIPLAGFLVPILLGFLFLLSLNHRLITHRPISLTQLSPVARVQEYGQLMTNMPVAAWGPSKNWRRLSVQYAFYDKGLGTHADSRIVYDLNRLFQRFTADIGIDTEAGEKASVIFTVFGDGRLLYQSDIVRRFENPRHIDVDVRHVKELTLIVDDAGDGNTDDHADWLNPFLFP